MQMSSSSTRVCGGETRKVAVRGVEVGERDEERIAIRVCYKGGSPPR